MSGLTDIFKFFIKMELYFISLYEPNLCFCLFCAKKADDRGIHAENGRLQIEATDSFSLRVSVMRSGQLSLLFTRFITLNDSPHISKCVISQHCLAQLRATIFMLPACLLILWTWSDAAAHIPAGSDQQSSRPGSLRCNQLLGLGLSVCVHTGTDD